MDELKNYTITWRDRDGGPFYQADGTKSDIERIGVQAVDEAEARDKFHARYGYINYEIVSVELWETTQVAQWVCDRIG